MPQQWPSSSVDTRTFGDQQARVLDDLNRPDLQSIVTEYLQDAMRYWARRPFFFTDTDNSAALSWTASVIVTQGTTIRVVIAGTTYNFVALNAGTTDVGVPAFPATLFTVPSGNVLPPPTVGTAGTVNDNGIIWANNGPIITGFASNTQLSTVYNVNQYTMPIDLQAFTRVECTWQGTIRQELQPMSYQQLRDLDVIRPTPPTTYPTQYCWYQQILYVWPYPVGLYPLTLSYRASPTLAQQASDTNFWTTTAEALIRHYANARISAGVLFDDAMAAFHDNLAKQEFLALQGQGSEQDVRTGIQASEW